MKKYLLFIVLSVFPYLTFSQGLFEDAVNTPDTTNGKTMNYQLNGYVRGVYYTGGEINKDKIGTNSAYGELDLKFRAKKGDWGDAFANFRYRYGREFGDNISDFNMREAYVKVMTGRFDFLIGKKILAWGRCDGFNPTDNLNSKNMIVRSPDEDDRRLGNFLFSSKYNINPFTFEFNWIPVYRSSIMPYNMVELPEYITLLERNFPGDELKNSSWAGRINLEKAGWGASVSYFEGLDPNPGIDVVSIDYGEQGMQVDIQPRPYRTRILGADFSTALGQLGLRGEFAYRNPLENHVDSVYIPWPDLQYVFGIDRTFGDTRFILQYIGRFVLDYNSIPGESADPIVILNNSVSEVNRKFNYQLDKFSHMISIRPSISFLHETLNLELFSLFNFTTNEYLLRPKLTYDIGDAFKLSFGAEYYNGEEESLFKILGDNLNGIFFELKASF